jgi:hypothetical protein
MLKIQYFWSEMSQIMCFSGKFLNLGKSASVKDLTNIMSVYDTHHKSSEF